MIFRLPGPLARAGSLALLCCLTVAIGLVAGPVAARADLAGADATLARAPYLTDLTTDSVELTWATTTQTRGIVRYGPAPDCTAVTITLAAMGSPFSVNGIRRYESDARLTGLLPGTRYCYRVYSNATSPVDLLGSNPSPEFTTLDPPGSPAPLTFAILGDWGDTHNGEVNDGSTNVLQANLLAHLGQSGARFVLTTGDTAYPSGTQRSYGDLQQTGADVSAVFGPAYWAVPGQYLPMFPATGNHGRTATYTSVWPEASVAARSGGSHAVVPFASINGSTATSYPTSYYAFSTGGVRVYVLDASWSDGNVGNATGGPCGIYCLEYEQDYEANWTRNAMQYQWLAHDLAAHPGGLKLAVFHYPLRSDVFNERSDPYLQRTPGSTNTLEQLLHDNGVGLVFNGHAHVYERHVATPGGVTSYVLGTGGVRPSVVGGHGCANTDAFGLGWSTTKMKGYACGTATAPSGPDAVVHYALVTVNGTDITVTPTDSQGRTFDVRTYHFGPDTLAPTPPAALTATVGGPTMATLDWSDALDDVGVTAYDIYRNGLYLATTPAEMTTYTDQTIMEGAGYTYEIRARDLAGNTAPAAIPVNGGAGTDTVAPTVPTQFAVSVGGPTAAELTWAAATDDVAISGYTILRDGLPVTTVGGNRTAYRDAGLVPGTSHSYRIVAIDTAGHPSHSTPLVKVRTADDAGPPAVPAAPVVDELAASSASLSWPATSDDVGLARYDVLRDGVIIASVYGTSFVDTGISPGTVYTYRVRAVDQRGRVATGSALIATTPLEGSLFFDGFEFGGLANWSASTGLTIQSTLARSGNRAVRAASSGPPANATKSLPYLYPELRLRAWVNVVSQATSVTLLSLRTAPGSSIVNLYLNPNGLISVRNAPGAVTTTSVATVAPGAWHEFALLANVVTGTVQVLLDGALVPDLDLAGQNLGTAPIGSVQLGEGLSGRTYNVVFDDVALYGPAPQP